MSGESKKKVKEGEEVQNAGLAGAAFETVQRYGDAAKQHFVAYTGEDNETGKTLVKGLKSISEEKIHPDYVHQNISQQAGFAAEVKDVARKNAEKIIKGDDTRVVRTDDLGRVNDPLYDTVTIDAHGNVIKGTEAQMKFLGASQSDPTGEGNAARALDKLLSKKFQKYVDADATIDVPSDQYKKMIIEADNKISDLTKKLKHQLAEGNLEQAEQIQEKIDKVRKVKGNLRAADVSSAEAKFARLHPELSTAVDVAKIANKAGMETAERSAIIGGSVSIVKNLVAVYKREEEPETAIINVAKDTATTAAVGYGTGFVGTALKGVMQNSSSEYLQGLSKTNIPATVAAMTVSAAKTLSRYINGEIDGVECLETLGEQGTGMISSAMYAAVGQALIPIPVIGGMIGGMAGYAISSASYKTLVESLKDAKLAKEEREYIEKICEEHIKMIREYRAEMEEIISTYLIESTNVFRDSFSGIKTALEIGDVDGVIDSTNAIAKMFGGQPTFSSFEEFEQKMLKGEEFKL